MIFASEEVTRGHHRPRLRLIMTDVLGVTKNKRVRAALHREIASALRRSAARYRR